MTSTRKLISCPILPRIANFDDLDPLKLEPEIEVVFDSARRADSGRGGAHRAARLQGDDRRHRRRSAQFGWDIDILAHRRRGGAFLGICGGYQMLGRGVADPLGLEGAPGAVAGLGLLDVETELVPLKALRRVNGTALGAAFSGYEMHMGTTTRPRRRPSVRRA